jgi:hypothetical protein
VVRTAYAHGVIKSSLSASAQRRPVPQHDHGHGRVLGYDIDFAQDIRPGDEFDVVYEQKVMDGKVVGTGNILSARFTNRGKTYTAVRYTNKQGNTATTPPTATACARRSSAPRWTSPASARAFPPAASTRS